jgi:transcriptional regulator with XRE-family HTH domain
MSSSVAEDHFCANFMPPFAHLFRNLRVQRNMRQKTIAARLGVDPSCISQWEGGRRPVPSAQVLDRICEVLELDAESRQQLAEAARQSTRKILISSTATPSEFRALHKLAERAGKLTSEQLEMIDFALRLGETRQRGGPAI